MIDPQITVDLSLCGQRQVQRNRAATRRPPPVPYGAALALGSLPSVALSSRAAGTTMTEKIGLVKDQKCKGGARSKM